MIADELVNLLRYLVNGNKVWKEEFDLFFASSLDYLTNNKFSD